MSQKKFGLSCAAFTCLLLGVFFLSDANTALGQPGFKLPKFNVGKLKLIINKTDPEIKLAQKALVSARFDLMKARNALNKAMSDEVFGEKGATEGAVIDQLKQSLKACNNAIADVNVAIAKANLAQFIDKGSD